ncbi:MAG: uroporphyrinogen-III synthase / uroporphyrinogen-III C-methyltransferase, partial [Deltaproteobacteria bacterium]|nr:uroporphyrinogen-III synthase / uroporphyrinogen-III C-methyltransferase [Deltaproteobacteria bacterium]
ETVYLIGAGPGDPGLITVRGRECISLADVVIYDYLANGELLKHAKPDAELIYAGKIGGAHNHAQSQINDLLVAKAAAGKKVARLKGGDPFVFGRGGEECEALVAAGISFEVVPGVTAAIGAAAYAGIPLTHRQVTTSVAFVTGHENPDKESTDIDWEKLSLGSGTVVFYMGVKNLPQIAENLMANGRSPDTPVALIRWGTRAEQEVLTGSLADIADKVRKSGFKAPAITVVGEVVNLRQRLRWFDNRPLFGRNILVTRAADQAGEFSRLLALHGARVFECPTISLVEPDSLAELDTAIAAITSYDWLILTSGNAVRRFFGRLYERGRDARALAACRVAAVGPKSAAAVREYGIIPDLVPADYKAEGVVAEFGRLDIAGKKILFPRADKSRELIPSALAAMGACVSAPVIYCNRLPETLPQEALLALEERRIDCVTFTASSTAENLSAMLGENRFLRLLDGVKVASIGPITTRTCLELGLQVDIEPEKYTLEKLTEQIVQFFK